MSVPERLRNALGVGVASLGIALVFPLAPWATAVQAAIPAWLARTLLLVALALGAWLLRPHPRWLPLTRWGLGEATALAAGLLLIMEPLAHTLVLQTIAWKPNVADAGLVFADPDHHLDLGRFLWLALSWVLLPAVIEEWFFRGRLLPWLCEHVGRSSAISITTLCFAAGHGSYTQTTVALVLGLILCLIRLHTGLLYPCIVAHALHNAIFLALGTALSVSWLLMLACFLGGGFLVAFAVSYHDRPVALGNRRFALGMVLGVVLALGVWPLIGRAHELAWCAAARQLVLRLPGHREIGRRLVAMEQRGDLGQRRADVLVEALLTDDAVPMRRRLYLLGLLDPAALPRLVPSSSAEAELAAALDLAGHGGARASEAIYQLCRLRPPLFAQLAQELGSELAALWPWDAWCGRVVGLIALQHGHRRVQSLRMLLAGHLYPDCEPGPALLRMPAASITPRLRYLMRMHLHDFDALLEDLTREDPTKAAAWRGT
ncbi:MAG: CPBP family intramembrane glutamic endopeptidase [Planctomycetota bacterium]